MECSEPPDAPAATRDTQPLTVLLADPHLRGGGQVRYVQTLAHELSALQHRVLVVCRPGSILAHPEGYSYATVDTFAFRGGLRLGAWISDIYRAMRLIRTERPDLIHVNSSQDHWTFAVANYLLDRPVPIVRTRHNTYVVKDNWPNRVLNRHLTAYQIAVCEQVRKTLSIHPAFVSERLCAIHNGVDTDLFAPHSILRQEARAALGCKENEVICGMVGRLVPAKGHCFLFRAVASLKELHPELRVLVLGEGVLEQHLRIMVQELGIADQVHFLGFRNDMNFCVQAFDLGVQPSIDCDTSSFSMKEQMATGIPVVASDYGGLSEIIDDGVEGFIVPAGTWEPLASAIQRLVADPLLRKEMGKRARERACRQFSKRVFVQETLHAYWRTLQLATRNRYGS